MHKTTVFDAPKLIHVADVVERELKADDRLRAKDGSLQKDVRDLIEDLGELRDILRRCGVNDRVMEIIYTSAWLSEKISEIAAYGCGDIAIEQWHRTLPQLNKKGTLSVTITVL